MKNNNNKTEFDACLKVHLCLQHFSIYILMICYKNKMVDSTKIRNTENDVFLNPYYNFYRSPASIFKRIETFYS